MFKYNATGIKVGTEFSAAPEGNYDLVILKASTTKDGADRITRNGDPYVMVECEVDSGEFMGNKVWTNVTFLSPEKKGSGMAIHFLKTIGQPWENEIDVVPEDWIGARFRAHLVVGRDQKGRPKNEIAYIISDDKPDESEVPF